LYGNFSAPDVDLRRAEEGHNSP